MVIGIVSLISLSDLSLLVYSNASTFCVLILCPATLTDSLVSTSSFLVTSVGFSVYSIRSSANRDCFTSFFPTWVSFISSLIALARTFKTMLNKSGESRDHKSSFPSCAEHMIKIELLYKLFNG